MLQPDEKGRPEFPAQDGPNNSDTTARQQQTSPTTASVSRGRTGRKQARLMMLTYLPPSGNRTQHWGLGRCPECGLPHLSRSPKIELVTRVRRLPCKHRVKPTIARTLSPYDDLGGAA